MHKSSRFIPPYLLIPSDIPSVGITCSLEYLLYLLFSSLRLKQSFPSSSLSFIIASDLSSVGITCTLEYLLSFRSYFQKLQLSLQCTPFPKVLCFFKAAPSDRLLTSRQIFSAFVPPINTPLPLLACQVPTENSSTFHLSCSRFCDWSHFVSFSSATTLYFYKICASLWEGIIAFFTLLLLFFFAASLLLCVNPVDLFISSLVFPSWNLYESFKHFLFVSFFLYLYYSRKFLFVNRFLKNFFNFFKIFL